jgi:hypothetical protein
VFDIDEPRAASLVAEGRGRPEDVPTIEGKLRKARKKDDPLAGVPTPAEPAHDLVADADEERLKPVLHVENKRNGGG